jgi:hypothetical protein
MIQKAPFFTLLASVVYCYDAFQTYQRILDLNETVSPEIIKLNATIQSLIQNMNKIVKFLDEHARYLEMTIKTNQQINIRLYLLDIHKELNITKVKLHHLDEDMNEILFNIKGELKYVKNMYNLSYF